MFSLDPKLETAIVSFEKGEKVEGMHFVNSRDEKNKAVVLTIECESISPIISSDYGQSVLCKLINGGDASTIEEIEESVKELLPERTIFKSFIQEEKFFLKLGVKDDKYKARIIPAANPNQLEKSPFYVGATLELEMNPNGWVRFGNDECHAGLFMNINKITIDGGKKKKKSSK